MKLSRFALFASLTSSTVGQAVKVTRRGGLVLLGDSITEITCWRPLVWEQLVSAGLDGSVDFVGSMSGVQGCSTPAGFDADHEGHSGWQAYDIARNNIADWVQSTTPDIVQFMLGTNDVNIGKHSVDDIIGSYTMMLEAMRAANPNVKVIVDKLIPTSWSDPTIEAVNTAIPDWVAEQTTDESPIAIADCSAAAGFTTGMLQGDGVHPNSQGDQFIAEQVGPQLIQFIEDVQGSL
ncbi:SGNH/GDSL hydrolase family protein [Aspergillus lucknowensis]|uniref:SGNH hydrolase-type esterase domain-containing protein n=1 Tax=Aspergillus lucknowensis TaxID=176173 RepID=A0ABR4L5R7_9EURO